MKTKLFTTEQVKRFFDILFRLQRESCGWYKGYYPNSPDYEPCQQDVFINRTINKWFKGKFVILYEPSKQLNTQYKKYVMISHIRFGYGYRDDVDVILFDYSRPCELSQSIKIGHNEALSLEGEWCENSNKHNQLLKLTKLDIPEKEFIVKAYDFSKYPKRKKKGVDPEKEIETTVSIKAKTWHEYYKNKKKFKKQIKETKSRLILGDVVKIKEIK